MRKTGEFLKEKRQARGMSLREASRASGMSHVHISLIEEGKRSPSFERMMKLLDAYMVDVNEFLVETGYIPLSARANNEMPWKKIPVISWERASNWAEAGDGFSGEDAEDWLACELSGADVFALRVRDDSMLTEFHRGDIIIVNPDIKPEHNDYVIVTEDGKAALVQFKKYRNTSVLHPLNPYYEDTELSETSPQRIIGKVVMKEKRYA